MLPIMHGKKMAQAILGGDHEEASEAPEGGDGLHAAAEEILSAIESKDPAALVEALKAFVDQASGVEEESEE